MPQSWDMGQMYYFPSEGRHAEDFFNRKNPTASVGSEPAILGTRVPRVNQLLLNFVHRLRIFLMEYQPVTHITLREVNRSECPIFENRGELRIAASQK
jgi:hypothetical protein